MGASAIILAEDKLSANLLRRYAIKIGVHKRSIRICELPSGAGSGKQKVISQYANEVKRLRQSKISKCLFVHIDADNYEVHDDKQLLDQKLHDAGFNVREPQDRIAIIIPKRHTETWICCFVGKYSVNELEDYKSQFAQLPGREYHLTKLTAENLYERTRLNSDSAPQELPSVGAAVLELQRLEE